MTQAALATAPFTMADTRPSDRRALGELRGAYAGRQAFILGNGRSLSSLTGSQLLALGAPGRVTFVCNFITRWDRFAHNPSRVPCGCYRYDHLSFVPTFYCASESDMTWDIADGAAGLPRETTKLYSHAYLGGTRLNEWIRQHNPGGELYEGAQFRPWVTDWVWLYRRPYFPSKGLPLARMDGEPLANGTLHPVDGGLMDGKDYLSSGGSVVLDCALQVAVWTGCQEIYLLGVDATQEGHVYDRGADKVKLHEESRLAMIRSLRLWEERLGARGIKVRSLSPGGNLTVPKMDVREGLSG